MANGEFAFFRAPIVHDLIVANVKAANLINLERSGESKVHPTKLVIAWRWCVAKMISPLADIEIIRANR